VNSKDLIISLNLLFQLAPASLWGEALHISGLFATILDNLLNDEVCSYILAPHCRRPILFQVSVIVLTECIHTFSRIALGDRQMFITLMSATAASKNTPESKLWEGLLDQWWTRVGLVSSNVKVAALYLIGISLTTCLNLDTGS